MSAKLEGFDFKSEGVSVEAKNLITDPLGKKTPTKENLSGQAHLCGASGEGSRVVGNTENIELDLKVDNKESQADCVRKRTLEALERRFAQAEADLRRQQEHKNKKQRTLITATPQGNKTPSQITNRPPSSDPSISITPSRKGNVSFLGHSSSQDVESNHPAYFQLSHSVDGNLLSTVSEVSNGKSTVDYVLHELLQHGDSAQKYMQGSKSVKIDNYILLDNVVQKSSMSSGANLRALKCCSKRSKKHMSLKQHKKCRSFDLPPELHKYEIFKQMHEMWKCYINKLVKNVGKNQLAQCLLNADLHGALILVAHCKLDGYTGLNGIMIRGTAETFGIITEDNRFKVVPKKLSVFMLQADSWKVTILGEKLASRNMIS